MSTPSTSTTTSLGTGGLAQPSGCPDPNNCDALNIALSVTWGAGEWDSTASANIQSKRIPPGPSSLTQTLQFRHHDNAQDFNVVVGPMTGPYCNSTYCLWETDAYDLVTPEIVKWFNVVIGVPPSFSVNTSVFPSDVFVSSAKTSVTDSNGTNTQLCGYAVETTPDFNYSTGYCNYGNPLP